MLVRTILEAHSLHAQDPQVQPDGNILRTLTLALTMLVQPINGSMTFDAAELHALSALDGHRGKLADRIGRVTAVLLDSATRTDRGIRIQARLELASLIAP